MRESRFHPHAKIADFSMCALQFILQQRCGALAKNCLCNAYLTPRLANPQKLTTPPRSRSGGCAGHGDSAIRRARRLGHAPIVDARLHQQSRAADRAPRPTRSRSRRHPRAASNHAAFAGDRDWHRVRVRHAVEVVRMPAAIGNSAPKIACIQYPRAQRCRATIKAPRPPRKSSANHCRHPASIHSARC